jgi:phosphoglycolate phosphatase-like HAD superfamily hydrolase
MNLVNQALNSAEVLFWDFDGVIKDSVNVKSMAFEQLFLPFGKSIADRVRLHHECNGGVSRYDKIPIYLAWAGEAVNDSNIQKFCDRFSSIVQQAVIDSPWVPGVREYLEANFRRQRFVLVTATPQAEITKILTELNLLYCFTKVYGAPKPKSEAVRECLLQWKYSQEQAILIGDSRSDRDAAEVNGIRFLLRRTPLNHELELDQSGFTIEGF